MKLEELNDEDLTNVVGGNAPDGYKGAFIPVTASECINGLKVFIGSNGQEYYGTCTGNINGALVGVILNGQSNETIFDSNVCDIFKIA